MKKILFFALLALQPWTAKTEDFALVSFEVWGQQIYRLDVKTNLTDKWYPYSVVAMWRNCEGTNTDGTFRYGPEVRADQHQPCMLKVPIAPTRGFFRLYTLPENTNGVVWPTASSTNVPFKLTFEFSVFTIPPETNTPATHTNHGHRPKP